MIKLLLLPITVLLCMLQCATADEEFYKFKPVETIKIQHGDASLNIQIKRLKLDNLKIVPASKDAEEWEKDVWMGKKKLPREILYYYPSIITSFTVTIGKKTIKVPERFWSDITGFDPNQVILNRQPKDSKEWEQLGEARRWSGMPTFIHSADGGTVLIRWQRSEE